MPVNEATKVELVKLMESLYDPGYGGGYASSEEVAEALLKKYRITKREERDNG